MPSITLNRLARMLVILLITAAGAQAAPEHPHFIATAPPLAAILREITGTRAQVTALLPVGASDHTYQPRPSDARAAESASCLFYISKEMDAWAAGLSAPKKVDVFTLLPPRFLLPELDSDNHAPDHATTSSDPHFWLDPLCVKAVLPGLVRALSDADPGGRTAYETNAKRFASQLDSLNHEIATILAPVRGRPVFLFHPSFRYFLKRYNLNLAGVIELFPGKEPSPRYLQTLVERVRKTGAKAVFTEPQLDPRPAQVVAEAAGVPVRMLDPLGGQPGRASYAQLLRYNARILYEALK